jgi:hypothetical protein
MAVHPRGSPGPGVRAAGLLLAVGAFLCGGPAHAVLPPPSYGGWLAPIILPPPPPAGGPTSGSMPGGSGGPVPTFNRLPQAPVVNPPATYTLSGGSRIDIGRKYLHHVSTATGGGTCEVPPVQPIVSPTTGNQGGGGPGPTAYAPELDAGPLAGAITLATGSLLLLTRRNRARGR